MNTGHRMTLSAFLLNTDLAVGNNCWVNEINMQLEQSIKPSLYWYHLKVITLWWNRIVYYYLQLLLLLLVN